MKWWVVIVMVLVPYLGQAAPENALTIADCEQGNKAFQKYSELLIGHSHQCQDDFTINIGTALKFSGCEKCCRGLLQGANRVKSAECFFPRSCAANFSRQTCVMVHWDTFRKRCKKDVPGYDDHPWAVLSGPFFERVTTQYEELRHQYRQRAQAE